MPTYVTSEDLVDRKSNLDLNVGRTAVALESPVDLYNSGAFAPPCFSFGVTELVSQQKEPAQVAQQSYQCPQAKGKPTADLGGISLASQFMVLLSFALFFLFGTIYDLVARLFGKEKSRDGYAPLLVKFNAFFQRHFCRRFADYFNVPIDSRPSRVMGVMERVSKDYNCTYTLTGKINPCVNLASYNYLGFADDVPSITQRVLESIDRYGIASCSAPQMAGQHRYIAQLERAIADFLGKDDAIVCGMGFGTNLCGLPALFGKGSLVISDSLNHSSLVNGVRMSGATVKVFEHGNFDNLEMLLHEEVVLGQNRRGEYVPWIRIILIVEGVYSMEGVIVDLQRLVALKKRYGALLFVDEAHSIGSIGRTGRGVTEHYGVDTKDVDVLMGTFTKSFGSIGGYLASDQSVVDYLRTHSSIALHCDALAPPCAEQALAALDVICGRDGTDIGRKRLRQLKENSRFFRKGLIARGFKVLGDDASPVVPVMLYHTGKLMFVAEECRRRGLAIVIVGYPATPLLAGRARFCISAAHTREDLQFALNVMDEVAEMVHVKYTLPTLLP